MEEITLKNLWDWVMKGIVFILVIALFFGIGAFAYNKYFVDPVYEANVKFYARGMETTLTVDKDFAPQSVQFLNVNEFYEMVSKDLLATTGTNLSPKEIAGALSFSAVVEETSSFFVAVTTPDPNLSYNIALSVAKMAPERVDSFKDVGSLKVLSNPILPTQPKGDSALTTALIGLFAGFVVGAGIVILKELLDNRIKTSEEINTLFGIPVLGVVPDFSAGGKKGGK